MSEYVILLEDNQFLDFENVKNELAFTIKSVDYHHAYVFGELREAQEEFKAVTNGGINGYKYYKDANPIAIFRVCETE